MSNLSNAEDSAPARPPGGPRLGCLLSIIVVVIIAFIGGIAIGPHLGSSAARAPGSAESKPTTQTTQWYTCGMHPQVRLPSPGECPICHMKLVPVIGGAERGQITIDPVIVQNIGVRTTPVTTGPVTRDIRTVGTIDYNETRVRDVNLKISGWVEKLYVSAVGEPVKKGQPLLELYSPELYTAQAEYIQALRNRAGGGSSPPAEGDLLEAARKRLEYFDISAEQVKALEQSGKPAKTMTIASPFDGTVVIKNVVEGMKVEAGTQLYRIADLSNLWVMVTLYENQLPFVQVGQTAVMTLPYVPGQTFEGKVTYIYPYLNPQQRQGKLRLEFDNPTGLLKPGMYANIELHSTFAKDKVLAPREAVIDTGTRQIAFVSLGQGRFEPRPVKMGVDAQNGMVEILDGLKPGEVVVTSAQFLLDSEARMREATAKMTEGTPAAGQETAAAVTQPAEIASLPAGAAGPINEVIAGYMRIGDALAGDTLAGVDDPARKIAAAVDRLLAQPPPRDEHFWHKHTEVAQIRGKALELVGEKDIAQAREKFADLSIALSKLLHATGVPPSFGREVQELHCPMYREGQGGNIWLQGSGEVRNPFFGAAMLGCFDKRLTLPVMGEKSPGATTAPAVRTTPAAPVHHH